jgi:hypothetical protein
VKLANVVLAGLVMLSLGACAGTPESAEAPTSAAPSVTSTPTVPETPTATPTPTPTETAADASSATCDNLLDADTITALTDAGSEFSDNDKADTYPFSAFLEYGGISCVWGASLTVTTAYTYGPISEEKAAAQQKKLKKMASKSGSNENGGTYYEVPGGEAGKEDAEIYVFSPKGYWAWGFDNGGGQVIEEVVANAPVFY